MHTACLMAIAVVCAAIVTRFWSLQKATWFDRVCAVSSGLDVCPIVAAVFSPKHSTESRYRMSNTAVDGRSK